MDPGTILAVAELSIKTVIVIRKYYLDVKNAEADIKRLEIAVNGFYDVLQKVHKLVQSSGATTLPTLSSSSMMKEVKHSLLDITTLMNKLHPNGTGKIKRGFHILKWPLTSKEVDDYITKLEGYKTTIHLALSTDQT